jgi:hypothetical protein
MTPAQQQAASHEVRTADAFVKLKAHFAKLMHHTIYNTRLEIGEEVRSLVPLFCELEACLTGVQPAPSYAGGYGIELLTIEGPEARVRDVKAFTAMPRGPLAPIAVTPGVSEKLKAQGYVQYPEPTFERDPTPIAHKDPAPSSYVQNPAPAWLDI